MSFVRTTALAVFAASAALSGATAHAQVYRIVGPDGKVTFSDRPPVSGPVQQAPTVSINTASGGSASLSGELRKVATQYPVTLYTSKDCDACNAGRSWLQGRGIPFTEKTVNTREDVGALRRLAGGVPNMPFLTIGGQHLPGFAEPEWAQYLDAAGYPRTSQLPGGYRNPDPSPLVAAQRAAPTAAATTTPTPQPASTAAPASPSNGPSPSNPAGIRF